MTESFKQEHALGIYNRYEYIAIENNISLIPPIDDYVRRIEAGLSPTSVRIPFGDGEIQVTPISKRASLPPEIKYSPDDRLKKAGLFFLELIRPALATGKDAYKPTGEEILDFCQELTKNQLTIVMYYALSKTQSPIRTGSPDQIIDFAELEMLKYWATVIGVAQHLGFLLRIVFVDETWELPEDNILGFNHENQEVNLAIAETYLQKFLPNNGIIFRRLSESVRNPLGEEFNPLYNQLFEQARNNLEEQLNQEAWTPETRRLIVFLECMTPDAWRQFNIENLLTQIKNPSDLQTISPELLTYLINVTAHFSAIMGLRNPARERVISLNLVEEYPEYDPNRIYGGVTRSNKRWSFLPHPTKFRGETRNPMHGLAIYDNAGNFLGFIPYIEAVKNNWRIVRDNNNKPLFVVML